MGCVSDAECFAAALLYPHDPLEACKALVGEAYARWIKYEDRIDDITIIVAFVDAPSRAASPNAVLIDMLPDPAGPAAPVRTLGFKAFAVSMGFLSGFLGGLCGIRGPPLIIFFLHAPFPKNVQRANGAAITLLNVSMRILSYVIEPFTLTSDDDDDGQSLAAADWLLYVCVAIASAAGVLAGASIFHRMKDSQATIKTILALLLLLCGMSLLIGAFL